jgi:hypothetical protein
MEKKMRTRLLISFLIVALLTAASPAPQPASNNTVSTQIVRTSSITQFVEVTFPALISPFSEASPGCLAPKGLRGPTAPFKIENIGTKKANVNINGTSRNGNYVIYCSFNVKQGIPVIIELMWGNYVYLVARGSKTSRGSFFINSSDKATMRIFKDKIKIGPFP